VPRKKDSVATRRKQLFWHQKKQQVKAPSKSLSDVIGECPPKGSPLDNPSSWDALARAALRLSDDDNDKRLPKEAAALSRALRESLRRAFEKFCLDPGDPFSWRLLLTHFSFVEFGDLPRRAPGRALMWNHDNLAALLNERTRIMTKHRNPKMSDERVAKLLANDKNSQFYQFGKSPKDGIEGLRKALGKARRLIGENTQPPVGTRDPGIPGHRTRRVFMTSLENLFLRRSDAAEYLKNRYGLRCAKQTLAKLAVIGGGPKFHLANRTPLYAPADLDEWAWRHLCPCRCSVVVYRVRNCWYFATRTSFSFVHGADGNLVRLGGLLWHRQDTRDARHNTRLSGDRTVAEGPHLRIATSTRD
jgi:hypothetical protein